MKCLIVLSAIVAFVAAKPQFYNPYSAFPLAYASPFHYSSFVREPLISAYSVHTPALAGVKIQYHAQDELGQASYGHSEPLQTHSAVQDAAGNKVGSFSYVAPTGQVLRTDYVADAFGYRVASNALPVGPGPVVDTPEVVAARAAHLATHIRARRGIVIGHTPAATAPLGITPIAPLTHSAPLSYADHRFAYSAPIAYAAPTIPPVVHREATLTTVVNTPGHAVSYRVD